MKRQWANSYILIIFDECAFLMRVLQTQTRVRNFRMLVSHAFFGTHISGLHCMCLHGRNTKEKLLKSEASDFT